MLHAMLMLGAEAADHEPSKTAFYVLGGVLAAWAIVLAAIGLSRAEFPSTAMASRTVMALTVLFVAGAMTAAVATG